MLRLNAPIRHLIHPIYRYLETQVRPLRYLFLEVTQRCNLECRHCGSDCGKDPVQDELATADWLALIDHLPKAFPGKVLMPVISGGEPLCHPDFDQISEALGRSALPWGMVTNGYTLTAGALNRFQRNGLVSLTISLDGLEASHNWLRCRNDAYARAVESIRLAASSTLPMLDVVTCVNQRNLGELNSVRKTLGKLGVKKWRIFSTFPRGRARNDPELILDPGQTRVLLGWISQARKLSGQPDVQFSCEGYLPGAVDRAVRDEPYFCRAGICIASILADGSISACPNIPRHLIQGNVRKDDLATVWAERFKPFIDRSWMRTGPCATCRKWGRCKGNSLHLWDEETQQTARCYYRILREI